MRILGFFEISIVPHRMTQVWYRKQNEPRRVQDMTPAELRAELSWCLKQMEQGKKLCISPSNPTRKINAI